MTLMEEIRQQKRIVRLIRVYSVLGIIFVTAAVILQDVDRTACLVATFSSMFMTYRAASWYFTWRDTYA